VGKADDASFRKQLLLRNTAEKRQIERLTETEVRRKRRAMCCPVAVPFRSSVHVPFPSFRVFEKPTLHYVTR
jgi:hypothetical protein